jgi:CheY-like chemotaxis protein
MAAPLLMSQPNILVVDDDDDLRSAVTDALEGSGYAVEAHADGRGALTSLQRGYRPDLILMDLMMPVMSGWEMRNELQADPALAAIPLVVMTALQASDERVAGMKVLHKPFRLDTLIEVVEKVCR